MNGKLFFHHGLIFKKEYKRHFFASAGGSAGCGVIGVVPQTPEPPAIFGELFAQ
jgi:hypothetical protein